MKVCSRCHTNKPLNAFYKDARYRLGVMGWCIDCRNQNGRERAEQIRNAPKRRIREKKCPTCGEIKAAREFSRCPTKLDGLASRCKECRRERELAHRMTSVAPKRNHLWQHYRMTIEDLQVMIDGQQGRCAICAEGLRRPTIDHCHVSGYVRGILCHGCNTRLQPIENEVFAAKARAYLEHHRSNPPTHTFRVPTHKDRTQTRVKAVAKAMRNA